MNKVVLYPIISFEARSIWVHQRFKTSTIEHEEGTPNGESTVDCAALVPTAPWLVLGGLTTDFGRRRPCRSIQDRYQPRARSVTLKALAMRFNSRIETTALHSGMFTLRDDQARRCAACGRFTGGVPTAISPGISIVRDAAFIWSQRCVFARHRSPT